MTTPPRTQAERNADNALDVNRLRARNAELEAAVARVRELRIDQMTLAAFAGLAGAGLDRWDRGAGCVARAVLAALDTPEPVETLHGRNDEAGARW